MISYREKSCRHLIFDYMTTNHFWQMVILTLCQNFRCRCVHVWLLMIHYQCERYFHMKLWKCLTKHSTNISICHGNIVTNKQNRLHESLIWLYVWTCHWHLAVKFSCIGCKSTFHFSTYYKFDCCVDVICVCWKCSLEVFVGIVSRKCMFSFFLCCLFILLIYWIRHVYCFVVDDEHICFVCCIFFLADWIWCMYSCRVFGIGFGTTFDCW